MIHRCQNCGNILFKNEVRFKVCRECDESIHRPRGHVIRDYNFNEDIGVLE